ncbi:hypothetical protein O6H91_17G029800 [Diphasiastrum complanatum]|uniref:Uncharacterized protein n=1 Tax=Diphasiastrum complanatum TaxID=34168 RepID=A0ACC2B5A6_DIPCM|nr:hypothetical protein O6H91_17G029800 [Diphasiastrum complanatum]
MARDESMQPQQTEEKQEKEGEEEGEEEEEEEKGLALNKRESKLAKQEKKKAAAAASALGDGDGSLETAAKRAVVLKDHLLLLPQRGGAGGDMAVQEAKRSELAAAAAGAAKEGDGIDGEDIAMELGLDEASEGGEDGEVMDVCREGMETCKLIRVSECGNDVQEAKDCSKNSPGHLREGNCREEDARSMDKPTQAIKADKALAAKNKVFADNGQLDDGRENALFHGTAVHMEEVRDEQEDLKLDFNGMIRDPALAEKDELKQNKCLTASEIYSDGNTLNNAQEMANEGFVNGTFEHENNNEENAKADDEKIEDVQKNKCEINHLQLEESFAKQAAIPGNKTPFSEVPGNPNVKGKLNVDQQEEEKEGLGKEQLHQLKVLLKALALISRDVPLSSQLLQAVMRIHHSQSFNRSDVYKAPPSLASAIQKEVHDMEEGALLDDFEMAIASQRPKFMSAAVLREEGEYRTKSRLTHRLQELEDCPWHLGDDVQRRCYVELQSLKLLGLQKKVRWDVAAEHHLQNVKPEKHLLDWGLMRLRRQFSSIYGGSHSSGSAPPSVEADERLRRKRELERQRRLEEEERTRIATRKRKFFSELLNFVREFQLQGQADSKLQKQRNDGVQAWHAKQRQRATRAEKMRYQALRADDQEAYMKMVEESKNERLMTLLSKTDDLLQRLGAMVQRQKDSEPETNFKKEKHKEKNREHPRDVSEVASPRLRNKEAGLQGANVISPRSKEGKDIKQAFASQEEEDSYDDPDFEAFGRKRDLLEGQRQYNSAVHKIEEKVTEQPAMLEGGQLRSYQIEGLQWMLSLYNNNLNGILADEMGLGKTIQTISLLAYLMENKGVTGPHIIIAPKAVLPNWAHEFATWAPSMITVVYDGRAEERKVLREEYAREGRFNVLVTHYDLIMRDRAFLKKVHWHYMVVDEGHRLKNHDCMLSRTLAGGYHMRRRLLLTGTPIQNSLQELWSLLNFLLPAIFNSSQNFEEWFNAPFADRSEVSLTEEEQLLVIRRLHQVIRPFLLRRKKSEVEKFLPGKTQVILKCDLSAWQRIYYQQIIQSGRVGLDSGKLKGLQNTAMQLRKCCNHPYLFLEGFEYDLRQEDEIVRSSGKFELLDRLLPKLARTGHRVLLFSQMTRLMDILERYLNWHGFKYLRLDGSTKTEERGLLLQQFNAVDSPYFMFLLSTRAGGLGLNLQTADTVILFDSDWNPQMDQQAEDRAHRIGQKKEVRVFVLVSVGSIEEEILERAKSKMGIDAKVIQAGLFNTTSTAQERREMLEEIMRKGTNALSTDVPSEREINHLAARSDEEFHLFEDMDEERRNEEEYRSRLMEEHEVPDWVFFQPENVKVGKNDCFNQVQEGVLNLKVMHHLKFKQLHRKPTSHLITHIAQMIL